MPAIKVTGAKGLHQVTATTDLPAGSISGQKKRVKTGFGDSDQILHANDSGTLFMLGSADTARQIYLPAASGSLAGWEVQFAMTGSTGCATAISVTKAGGCTTVLKNALVQLAGGAAGDVTTSGDSNRTLQFTATHDSFGPVTLTCVADDGSTIQFVASGLVND